MPHVVQLKARLDGAWWLPDGYVRIVLRRPLELHDLRRISAAAIEQQPDDIVTNRQHSASN